MANNTLLYGGGAALLALFLFSGNANASEPDLPGIDPDPDPGPEPDPGNKGEDDIIILPDEEDEDPVPQGTNWGVTPEALKLAFAQTEFASGIPGLARFLAVRSWSAYRAGKAIVGPDEAQLIAIANPNLCKNCHNQTTNEKKYSRIALENVTLPYGAPGTYDNVGKKKNPWPEPQDFDAWADFGSAGLFDILAGSHAHAGYESGGFAPLIQKPPTVLFDIKVQCYIAAYIVYRLVSGPYKVLVAGDPRATWINIQRAMASPSGFVNNTQANKDVGIRFANRAKEIGIDLSQNLMPSVKNWPGAQAFYTSLGVKI